MAIRRPSISSPEWLFQDFLYQPDGDSEYRYLQVKWDGEIYTRVSQSFDYSDPPYVGPEQKGGEIVAQVDYVIKGKIVTILSWFVNWRDEWPLRLASNYLSQCLYNRKEDYVLRVKGDEVYTQSGQSIEVPNKSAYAFWVSEGFLPVTNTPDDYLLR
mgnify:CR=1 FL=1